MDADRAAQKAQDDPYLAAASAVGGSTVADDPYVKAAAQYGGRADAVKAERSLTDELGRQAGLALRYGTEGLVNATAGIFVDPFTKLARNVAGASFPTMSEATTRLLDRFGVPKPETPAEEVSGAISRGIAGGGGMAKLAGYVPELVGAAPAVIENVFAQKPLVQAAQAGIGGGAAELTKQAGGGELAQLVASALAPLGVTTAGNVAMAVGRGVKEAVRPVTQGGARQVAADVLGSITSDKERALANLEAYNAQVARDPTSIGVPGSRPTAGAVAADYGLIGGEQLAARGAANPDFAARLAANNEARLAELAKLNANKEQVAAFEARREAVTKPLRDDAFANATGPVDFEPIVVKILHESDKPTGGRAETEKALKWITGRIGRYLQEGRISAEHAYELHKDIGDLVAGKISQDGSALRLAGGVANSIKQELGLQIEKVAPGFKKYLETYSRLSKPIDRLEAITERLGGEGLSRVTNAVPMAGPGGPQFGLSQAKMRQQLGALEGELPVGPRGLPLAPRQEDILGRVMGDLNSETLALRGGKMPGSDTYQNMATANLLSSIFGKQLAEAGVVSGSIARPISFAYKPLEQRIRNLVDQAYLDPKLMEELLRIARTRRSVTLQDIATGANQNIYGGLIGGAAQ